MRGGPAHEVAPGDLIRIWVLRAGHLHRRIERLFNLLTEQLLRSVGLGEFVPGSMAKWRPLVIDGVLFFLQKLRPERQSGILAAQLSLPANAEPADRLIALLTECPTLHKLGQVVARHRQIPAELRRRLHALESMSHAAPLEPLLGSVRQDLPKTASVKIASKALAEASVAVVVPFTWAQRGDVHHGVFKILKPGIEERLQEELAIWLELGGFLEQRSRELGLPALDYRDTLDSVRELLANEVRLGVEQANLARAAAFYANDARVQVPRLLPWCSPRVTAMERVFGTKVTDSSLGAQARQRLADVMIAALLARPFWSRADDAFIHADPHAGNLFATDDGRLAVLDWSLVARLSKAHREAIVDAALGGLTLDAARTRRALASLGSLTPDHPVLVDAVERAMQRVRQFSMPGFDWLLTLLDDVASRTEAGFRDDLILFRKAWLTLAGVIGDVAGERAPDGTLIKVGLERFISELPRRAVTPIDSRRFDTHLSSADLVALWLTAGLVPTRFWLGFWRDASQRLVGGPR